MTRPSVRPSNSSGPLPSSPHWPSSRSPPTRPSSRSPPSTPRPTASTTTTTTLSSALRSISSTPRAPSPPASTDTGSLSSSRRNATTSCPSDRSSAPCKRHGTPWRLRLPRDCLAVSQRHDRIPTDPRARQHAYARGRAKTREDARSYIILAKPAGVPATPPPSVVSSHPAAGLTARGIHVTVTDPGAAQESRWIGPPLATMPRFARSTMRSLLASTAYV